MNYTKNIGIIGGGQLGKMMAISAMYMGHRIYVLDPNPQCPASQVGTLIVGEYHDRQALRKLSDQCDIITFEFENVDVEAISSVIPEHKIPQGIELLKVAQNRILEKQFLQKVAQVPVAPFQVVHNYQELNDLSINKSSIAKTATGGYDGLGQMDLNTTDDLTKLTNLPLPLVIEEKINFDMEVSIIIGGNGEDYVTFPLQKNLHRNHILYKTIVGDGVSEEIAQKAEDIALKIARAVQLKGVLCVEMFVVQKQIYVNELAPRPHNSGHYSIEACNFSQFDLHLLGILQQPLPKIILLNSAIMFNILGKDFPLVEAFLREHPQAKLHLYGKVEARKQRKMGHITVLTDDFQLDLLQGDKEGKL